MRLTALFIAISMAPFMGTTSPALSAEGDEQGTQSQNSASESTSSEASSSQPNSVEVVAEETVAQDPADQETSVPQALSETQNAQDVEATPINTNEVLVEEPPIEVKEPPKAYSACSADFHRDLRFINHSYAAPLRASIARAQKRNKQVSKKLILPIPKQTRSRDLNRAIQYTRSAKRNQFAESWLWGDGASWLMISMTQALDKYTSQASSPFLCTGMTGFVKYLEPHKKKVTRVNDGRVAYQEAAFAAVTPAANDAWHAIKPVPLPNFASKDRPSDYENILHKLRMKAAAKRAAEAPQKTADAPSAEVLDDPDLPALSREDDVFAFNTSLDIQQIAQELYMKAVISGILPEEIPDPTLGTGGDPNEIFKNAREWLIGDKGISQRRARLKLLSAFSAMEIAYNIELAAEPLKLIDERLTNTFSSIKDSHTRNCTCQ